LEEQLETQGTIFASLVVHCTELDMKLKSLESDPTMTRQIVASHVNEHDLQRDKRFRYIGNGSSNELHNSVKKSTSSHAECEVSQQQVTPSVGSQQQDVPLVVSKTDNSSASKKSRGQFESDVKTQRRGTVHISVPQDSPLDMKVNQMVSHKAKDWHGHAKIEHAEEISELGKEQTSKLLQPTSKFEAKCDVSKGTSNKESALCGGVPKRAITEEEAMRSRFELQRTLVNMMEKKTACRKLRTSQTNNAVTQEKSPKKCAQVM